MNKPYQFREKVGFIVICEILYDSCKVFIYLVVSKGGQYTKHIYIGSQRIVSKLGDLDSYGQDPRRIEYAGAGISNVKVDYKGKYQQSQQAIKDNYATFEVPYYGKDNDDYVNGGGFCCGDSPKLRSFDPSKNDNPELFQYYYHSDHLGSSSLITNLDGEIVQHIEYVPFGEVFIEERNNKWNTPYLFNAKELDEETGLYYYGARYYDPRISLWLSTDPLQEKYPNISTYAYTLLNPVKYIDPDGRKVVPTGTEAKANIINSLSIAEAKFVKFSKDGSIDQKAFNKGKSNSANFTVLKALVNSEQSYKFIVSDKDVEGEPFREVNEYNFYRGLTATPGAENKPSPDENVYIYTSSLLSKDKQVENMAHEAYGHAYFYELGKTDKSVDFHHRYINELGEPEWDEEFKMYVAPNVRVESNKKLQEQIEITTKEAKINYESRSKD